ncbi:DUF975 domain-containing protein [Anabaena sp. FACHB-1237]|uniref:DUF975 domain-containing protein n=1 Tax=Anabaena sp. FACHB-1237 TaxID=2692769 RepID=UPI0016801B39|nr:DUF975 domain-containing protein [Anabaena sp. FACHB-1237]MBD2139433.1 DUF975 domain-containing protein [Anabaena sp. FACHB-1237]
MSGNVTPSTPTEPLSVGSVVTAGVRLYRSHLQEYFLIALKAYFWLLIPIYGWAKFYALSSLISRLAFGELVNQPESVASGERFVNSRLGEYLLTMILIFFINFGAGIGFGITIVIVSTITTTLLGGFDSGNTTNIIILILISIVACLAGLIGALWFFARFYLVDIPLAVEENIDSSSTIGRSWELTKGYVGRIMLISFVSFLIVLPVQIIVQIVITIIQALLAAILIENNPLFNLLYWLIVVGLSFSTGALIIPFWQSIKAVVYYDLRSRREGLGLQLRNYDL